MRRIPTATRPLNWTRFARLMTGKWEYQYLAIRNILPFWRENYFQELAELLLASKNRGPLVMYQVVEELTTYTEGALRKPTIDRETFGIETQRLIRQIRVTILGEDQESVGVA